MGVDELHRELTQLPYLTLETGQPALHHAAEPTERVRQVSLRDALAKALTRARVGAEASQRELARATGIDQSRLSRAESADTDLTLDEIAAIETALELPRGALLRQAGAVAHLRSVESAILVDERLDRRRADDLIAIYRTLARRS